MIKDKSPDQTDGKMIETIPWKNYVEKKLFLFDIIKVFFIRGITRYEFKSEASGKCQNFLCFSFPTWSYEN